MESVKRGLVAIDQMSDELCQTLCDYAHNVLGVPEWSTFQPTAVVNEAFARLRSKSPPYPATVPLIPLMIATMRRVLLESLRKRVRRLNTERKYFDLRKIREGEKVSEQDALEVLEAFQSIQESHPAHAQVLDLVIIARHSKQEAAEILNMSRAEFDRIYKEARLLLRRRLEGE